MSNLSHEEIRKREDLKKLLDSELFGQAMFDVRQQMGDEMLKTNDSVTRERLHLEANLLNRLQGRLNEYAAELMFLKKEDAA